MDDISSSRKSGVRPSPASAHPSRWQVEPCLVDICHTSQSWAKSRPEYLINLSAEPSCEWCQPESKWWSGGPGVRAAARVFDGRRRHFVTSRSGKQARGISEKQPTSASCGYLHAARSEQQEQSSRKAPPPPSPPFPALVVKQMRTKQRLCISCFLLCCKPGGKWLIGENVGLL